MPTLTRSYSRLRRGLGLVAIAAAFGTVLSVTAFADTTILNVSYDPTRELYKAYDAAFAAYWKEKTGETVTIEQSHGGSGAQARAVIDGLAGRRRDAGARGRHQQDRRAPACSPRTGAPGSEQLHALHLDDRLPRPQGQPEGHQGLGRPRQGRRRGHHAEPEDLRRRPLELSRRLGLRQHASSAATRRRTTSSSATLYKNVPVLDSGARGSTTTFVQRGIGDVLLAWENEAFLAVNELGPDQFEIVVPPTSIKAEPPVALVDANVDEKGTREVAQAYLDYLYSDEAQKIIAKNYYRPAKPEVGRSGGPEALPRGEARLDRRSALRRLGQGAAEALRRRRHLRPDLPADQ